MKRCLLIVVLLFVSLSSYGQGWNWAKGTRGNNNYGRFCTTDTFGSIYVTGETFGACYFPSDTLPSIGKTRLYLSKFDSSGNINWIIGSDGWNSFGSIATMGIATDLFGNIYVLGLYDSIISFGSNTLANPYVGTYPGYRSYFFLAKFDNLGNNKWIKGIGDFPNYSGFKTNNGITIDCKGNIYLICNFAKNAHIGSYSFINKDTSGATPDMIVAKLDSSGNTIWARSFGGSNRDMVESIALSPSNDIFIAGSFHRDTLVIGGNTFIDTVTPSPFIINSATFIAKLDNSGNPIWSKSNINGSWVYLNDIAVNSDGEVFAFGYYNKNLSLGTNVLPYAYSNSSYNYLAKYDASGNISWVKIVKGVNPIAEGITLDGCGDAWVYGHFYLGTTATTNDTIDGHIFSPPSKNTDPLYIAGWTSSGTYIGASVLASGGRSSYKISITADKASKLYIVGNNNLDTLSIAGNQLYGSIGTTNMF